MISVVIPLYNKASFVSKTIASVLEQSFKDFEVIVVNDGSTDGSLAVVEQIKDARIRVLSLKHSGVSVARNTGIERAQFDWIAFLDADDKWAPTFLAEMVQAMKLHPEKSIFASGRTRIFPNSAERYAHEYLPKDGTTALLNYFKLISVTLPPVNASNVVIRKSLFDANGYFRSNQHHHEDHDLWLRLAVNEPIVFVNKPLSIYNKLVRNSQSTLPIEARDFIRYLETMSEVKEQLTSEEQSFFSKYSKRFIVLTYLKNERHFNKKEAKAIQKKAKPLLSRVFQWILASNRYLYFWNVYRMIRPLI